MFEKKVDLSPFCIRARVFISQGKIQEALDLYGDVLQVDPNNGMAFADRGTTFAMVKNFDQALTDLENAFALGYKDVSAYCTTATIHYELKQFDKALEYFSKALELDPTYSLIYYNRSNVHYELSDIKSAIADLEKCIKIDTDPQFKQQVESRLQFLHPLLK